MTSVIISKKDDEGIHRKESNVDTGIGREKTVEIEEVFRNLENEFMPDKTADEAFRKSVLENELLPDEGLGFFRLHVSEKMMIWDSWKKKNRSDLAHGGGTPPFAIHFLLWLFDNIPGMRDRFDKFDANQKDQNLLIGDEMFIAHARLLVGELYAIIKLLPGSHFCPEDEMLKNRMYKLAETHVGMVPSVGLKYFVPLHEKIHLFVSKRLGVLEESEVCQLWYKLFVEFSEFVARSEHLVKAKAQDEYLERCRMEEEKKKASRQKGCCLIL